MFRIAMCLSVLRLAEDGDFESDITCLDADYRTAKTIATVILRHNIRVFFTLPATAAPVHKSKGAERTVRRQQFWDSLPAEFDRKEYSRIADTLGLNSKSLDRTIRKWCDEGKLENISHGRYRKV